MGMVGVTGCTEGNGLEGSKVGSREASQRVKQIGPTSKRTHGRGNKLEKRAVARGTEK